jgi:L-iditol 2-dehydrogenase
MKVVRLHSKGQLELHNEPSPQAKPGQSLIHVGAVGICGSDLKWFISGEIGDEKLARPLVLGHEFAGRAATGPYAGQMVAVDPLMACGVCELCEMGHPNLCLNQHFAGLGDQDGALCETIAWPDEYLFALPDSFSAIDAAMLEPLGVAIHAFDLAHQKPGFTVGIFGCGTIGLLLVQLSRLMGATRILATDLLPHRIEAARRFGADDQILATPDGKEHAEVLAATGGRGVDIAFEVSNDSSAVEAAIAAVRPGGQVILIGIPDDDRTTFKASTARRKGLMIKLVRRMKHVYPRAIQFVENGQIDVGSLVTGCFSLDQADEAFNAAARREGLKIIIEP